MSRLEPDKSDLHTLREILQIDSRVTYKVTRRFDLINVFVVTFFCSAILGIFQACQMPLQAQAAIIGVIGLMAVVQMFSPESQVRLAAIGVGWFVVGSVEVYQSAIHHVFIGTLSSACLIFGLGSLLGYCAGTAVAGVFLISDYVRVVLQNIFGSRSQFKD